jgi:hypothetical protein
VKSLVAQSLHYFSRPHERIRREPLAGRAAWRARDLSECSDWRHDLGDRDIAELEHAIAHARRAVTSLDRMSRRDFPLPSLSARIADWRRELSRGRGVIVLRGLPVERWSQPDSELCFWGLGQHLGLPGAQNPEGDRLGHVFDTGASAADPKVRAYRTSANIAYHCDAADVVGLLCLRRAAQGGASRIVSSVSVYNALLARRPDLVEVLYQPFLLDTHGEGGVDYFPIPPCRYAEGVLRTFYHSDYFRSVHKNARVPPLTTAKRELLDLYDEIALSPELYFDMQFEPGDIQLLSNHVVLHARTAYEDDPDPAKKRHLLRLWLSLAERRSIRHRALEALSVASLVYALARLKAKRAFERHPKSQPGC